jgi:hypothetical protein
MCWLLLDEKGRGDYLDVLGRGVPVSSPYPHIYLELASLEYASSRRMLYVKRLTNLLRMSKNLKAGR